MPFRLPLFVAGMTAPDFVTIFDFSLFLSKTRVTASVVIFTVFSVFSALYFGVSRLRNHTDCVASSMNFPVTDVSTRKSLSVSTVMRKFLPKITLLFNASGCVTAISLSSSLTLLIKMRAAK